MGNSLVVSEKKEDRISELPDDVLHDILRLLPIKSAARTVALSRRWQKLFSSIPDLDFTTIATSSSSGDEDLILQSVLSSRDRNFPIRTLKLEADLSPMILDCLTGYVRSAGTHIQELDVESSTYPSGYIEIHPPLNMSTLIDCESLKVLRLKHMNLSLAMNPPFKSLHTMTLSYIFSDLDLPIFTDAMFPRLNKLRLFCCYALTALNCKCSELQDLVIKGCQKLEELDIYGMKLESLTVHTCFIRHYSDRDSNIKIIAPVIKCLKWVTNDIIHIPLLEKSPLLLDQADLGFTFFGPKYYHHFLGPQQRQAWSKMFLQLSKVNTFKFHYPSIEILAKNDFQSMLVNKFDNLRRLEICTEVNSENSFQGITTLFRNSPNVHNLVITISCHHWFSSFRVNCKGGDEYWEDQVPQITSFLNHLKVVEFVGFLEQDIEICNLAKFLLKHGENLENMILYLKPNTKQFPNKKQPPLQIMESTTQRIEFIKKLSWVSSKVKVVLS